MNRIEHSEKSYSSGVPHPMNRESLQDVVLLMSVNPGFGSQSFIDSTLRKAEKMSKIIDASGSDIRLEIDGGVKVDNIRSMARHRPHEIPTTGETPVPPTRQDKDIRSLCAQ